MELLHYIDIVHYNFACDYIKPISHICWNLLKTDMEMLIARDKELILVQAIRGIKG